MCRLVAYLGHNMLLEDVLIKPVNSIVMQSLHARETSWPTNGDGFGLGWYAPSISPEPALFKSISPAWNNLNLLHLAAKIQSTCFLAHVRAASTGIVSETNCHPFIYQRWLLMHNGEIYNFLDIKRHLRHLLDDDIYNWIKGETDSEHLFALFIQLAKGRDMENLSVVAQLLEETLQKVMLLMQTYGKPGPCYFNICLSDGNRIVASRCCTDPNIVPETMHYSIGSRFVAKDGRYYHMQSARKKNGTVMVASEKLTDFDVEWHDVPTNHLVLIDRDLNIQLRPLVLTTYN